MHIGRVENNWEEEKRCPKISPLTLIGITKPPSNKGKEKIQESEEEERGVENTKQALVVRNVKQREERQSSPSFDWIHEQPNEAYQNEQAEM